MPTKGSRNKNPFDKKAAHKPPAPAFPPGPILGGGMVTVKTCSSEMDAHLAQSKLDSEGIHSFVHRFSRYRSIASGGYLLKVAFADAARAKEILEKTDQEIDMDEYVDSDDDSYIRCPKCHSVNVVAQPLTRGQLALTIAGLGIPLFFITRNHACRRCKNTWRE